MLGFKAVTRNPTSKWRFATTSCWEDVVSRPDYVIGLDPRLNLTLNQFSTRLLHLRAIWWAKMHRTRTLARFPSRSRFVLAVKTNFQVDDHAQRVLVTGGAGYIGWHCPSPPPIDR